jgi:hypothetical protein
MNMRTLCIAFLLVGSIVAQASAPAGSSQQPAKHFKQPVTIQGCVSRSSGDYILFKQDPGVSYELQATGKMKLRNYLGQQVEVNGTESPSLSTSSDALTRTGSPASVTLTITSIKTIAKECQAR